MRFEVLGPVRVHRGEKSVPVGGRLRQSLLGVLLSRPNSTVGSETLIDALWGGNREADSRHAQRLHLHIHKLRLALDDADRLEFDSGGYRLNVDRGEIDAERFDTLVAEATGTHDMSRRAELLSEALGLWRGEPYQDLDLGEIAGEVQRLTERRLIATEERFTAELACGRAAAVVGELTELTRRHPLRERLQALLMTSLYRSGRQADALEVYRRARRSLIDELGLEPGPELREVERRILAGEPDVGRPNAGAPAVSRPAQLPHNVPGFVGRTSELDTLDRASANVVVITGTAGVGKTALAVRWAHGVKDRFPDGQLYVDLRGHGPADPVPAIDAVAGFLRSLGVDGTAIPQELTERAARLRTLLDGRRMLIVLDNASSVSQVRPLLPGSATCQVLVTSRDSMSGLAAREGAELVDLDRMSTAESRDLLAPIPAGDDPDVVEQLIERCARLPLALRIAVERMRQRRGSSVRDLVGELACEQQRLDLFDTGDPQTSMRAVLSWSYRALATEPARLFRLLAAHPGRDADVYALAALCGHKSVRSTRRLLDALVRAHLVDEVAPGRYQPHDLLRAYAAELLEQDGQRRAEAFGRLATYYLYTASVAMSFVAPNEQLLRPRVRSRPAAAPPLTSYETARRWLDTERANLIAVAEETAGHRMPELATTLSAVLWRYLDLGLHIDAARRLHGTALDAARENGDLAAQAMALLALGVVDLRMDRYERSTDRLLRAYELHQRVGAKAFQSTTLNFLGLLSLLTGRVEDAMRYLALAIELLREVGSRELLTEPLSSIATVYRRLGQHEKAQDCLRDALVIAEDNNCRAGQAYVLRAFAELHADMGRYDDALDCARRVRVLAAECGFHHVEGKVVYQIGTIYLALERYGPAVAHLEEALARAQAVGDNDMWAQALSGLAEACAATGSPDEAVRYHSDALEVASSSGIRYEEARAYAGLGDAHHYRGEHASAADHWKHALEIFHELGAPQADAVQAKLAG